jgi:predicted TIM-barrel fold metal-dependent hydrolase
MAGKIALEEHFSTKLKNGLWDAKGEERRNGAAYARDIERRLMDTEACLVEMDRAGIEMCIRSLTSPGVQGVPDRNEAIALARDANDVAAASVKAHPDRLSAFCGGAEQIGVDRVLFSVDYPYEQMDSAGRWFEDIRLDDATKLEVGRENATPSRPSRPSSRSER